MPSRAPSTALRRASNAASQRYKYAFVSTTCYRYRSNYGMIPRSWMSGSSDSSVEPARYNNYRKRGQKKSRSSAFFDSNAHCAALRSCRSFAAPYFSTNMSNHAPASSSSRGCNKHSLIRTVVPFTQHTLCSANHSSRNTSAPSSTRSCDTGSVHTNYTNASSTSKSLYTPHC